MSRLAERVLAHSGVALRFEGGAWTYSELAGWVETEVRALAAAGVGTGDRVAVLALNHPRTIVLLLACDVLGAMLVPLNWRLAADELRWILDDAAPRVVFGLGGGVPTFDACDGPTAWMPGSSPGTTDVSGVLLVYTSGTTGRPKGAVLSAAALLANAEYSWDMHALAPDDHVLTVLPLFHVGGLNIQTMPALLCGAAVTLHGRFEPGGMLEAIGEGRPTLTVLVPTTLQALAEHPGWAAADLSSLRAVTTGSTVVQPAAVAPFLARQVPVLQVYGSTETAPIAIYTRLGGAYDPVSTGHTGAGCEAVAVDARRCAVPVGVAGEIRVRGPQLFSGYWRNAAATAAVMEDGWYATGDFGTQAADRSWTVHDRRRNLIVSGGENVYPAEVERVLHEMPGVLEAAVVGAPDPRWQAVPVAHVVLRPGAACTEAEVIAFVRARLARFKAPRQVLFVERLPRNAMGKVQHAMLTRAP